MTRAAFPEETTSSSKLSAFIVMTPSAATTRAHIPTATAFIGPLSNLKVDIVCFFGNNLFFSSDSAPRDDEGSFVRDVRPGVGQHVGR